MAIVEEIESIRKGIKAGKFSNEASVSQGIVLRLLHALGWPSYDTDAVWPEYSLSGRRVDFALCSPRSKPIAFIEVKQIGQSSGAERQLFEYAFHDGVPLAVLTDGREWNFFLPGEQGDYGERRVYKLDIVDRDVEECAERLERYLLYSAMASGSAIQAAREDYRNVSKHRQMLAALPTAWSQLIADEDGTLLEIVADRAESLCGFRPDPDMVANFLKQNVMTNRPQNVQAQIMQQSPSRVMASAQGNLAKDTGQKPRPPQPSSQRENFLASSGQTGFSFEGHFRTCRNAIDTLEKVFNLFIERDPTFAERFAGLPKHGRTRRYLAKDANELYRDRPDLVSECTTRLESGWWMSTNHSKQTIGTIIAMACDVANIVFSKDLVVNLGD